MNYLAQLCQKNQSLNVRGIRVNDNENDQNEKCDNIMKTKI